MGKLLRTADFNLVCVQSRCGQCCAIFVSQMGLRSYENFGLFVKTITFEQEEVESSDFALKTVSKFLSACFFFSFTNTHTASICVC